MIRKIIRIDKEKCNGCGICANACHEGAIDIIDGKAKLVREHFCDGLGDCLPACPIGAITFEEREAPEYDEEAVKEAQKKKELQEKMKHMHEGGCPGSRIHMMDHKEDAPENVTMPAQVSQLGNWPVHHEFIRGKVTLIGCPKLDAVDYSEKLTQIIANNDIRSVTIVRMEVPCCGGLEMAAKKALQESGKFIQWQVVTIGIDGTIKE